MTLKLFLLIFHRFLFFIINFAGYLAAPVTLVALDIFHFTGTVDFVYEELELLDAKFV